MASLRDRDLLNSSLVADRRAAYLAGTSRSVGRGWSLRPPPTRLAMTTDEILLQELTIRYMARIHFQRGNFVLCIGGPGGNGELGFAASAFIETRTGTSSDDLVRLVT